jgi:DNA-binding PadR family transcriptional regulator
MEPGIGLWGRLRRDILRVFWRDHPASHPAKTSLQTRILFVLQDSYTPMTLYDIATEIHAQIEEIAPMLDQLLYEKRIKASWDGASPYRVYAIIRAND